MLFIDLFTEMFFHAQPCQLNMCQVLKKSSLPDNFQQHTLVVPHVTAHLWYSRANTHVTFSVCRYLIIVCRFK